MKILWLTIDRSKRTAFKIFTTLQDEASKIVNVDFVKKPAPAFIRNHFLEDKTTTLDVNIANDYDLIFTDSIFAYHMENWNKIRTPKAVLIEDQHPSYIKKYTKEVIKDFGFNIICVRYRDPTKKFNPGYLDKCLMWLPHSIDENMFKDYKLEKNIDILMTGTVNEHYPLRMEIDKLLKGDKSYKRIKRPKNGAKNAFPIGLDYVKELNKAKIATTCTSKYEYVVLKFFEIPAVNTALMSDFIPEMKDLGFIPDVNFIQINKGNILEKINFWRNNPKLEEISENGYNLIHTKHTGKVRAQEFVQKIEDYLKKI